MPLRHVKGAGSLVNSVVVITGICKLERVWFWVLYSLVETFLRGGGGGGSKMAVQLKEIC